MTVNDFIEIYREKQAPILGRDYIDGFIARNRARLERMIEPVVALINARAAKAAAAKRVKAEAIVEVEDPDTVTPEKDAIVWAAFMGLVNEKRRAIGMEELEVTESLPSRDQALNSARAAIGLAPLPPLAITLRHPKRRDLIAMITASVSEPGRFQLTWVDDEGPSGHTTRDTVVEAVRHAVDEGYRLDTASSGMARSLVERLQREREERAAKIESWLTESLPSRGTCGRTPKERRQAEHIAESYEDRGLDARTSKSRGCATVNARRNERMESLPVKLSEVEEGLVNELVAMGTPRRDARIAVIQTREDNVERRRARMSPEELGAVYARNAELLGSLSHRRAESIESLPKNVGRKGDGYRVGEHVIRIGDEIKMEGQLGGYVRSVDRSKGTAVIEQDNDEVKTWPIASLLHDTAANRQRQQDYNDKLAADAEAKLELSLADWRAQ